MSTEQQLFELRRVRPDTPEFRGVEFIEVEARRVVNRVPGGAMPFDWTINPYRGCMHACVYCFARPTHTYLDMDAGRDFETKIVVKVNAPQALRRELAARRWKGEHIAMGTATIRPPTIESEEAHRADDHADRGERAKLTELLERHDPATDPAVNFPEHGDWRPSRLPHSHHLIRRLLGAVVITPALLLSTPRYNYTNVVSKLG